MSLISKNKNL